MRDANSVRRVHLRAKCTTNALLACLVERWTAGMKRISLQWVTTTFFTSVMVCRCKKAMTSRCPSDEVTSLQNDCCPSRRVVDAPSKAWKAMLIREHVHRRLAPETTHSIRTANDRCTSANASFRHKGHVVLVLNQ